MASFERVPRGRPPLGAKLVDGAWIPTEESMNYAVMRLEKHRTQCRMRYRKNRAALLILRPDLFKKRKAWHSQDTYTNMTIDDGEPDAKRCRVSASTNPPTI